MLAGDDDVSHRLAEEFDLAKRDSRGSLLGPKLTSRSKARAEEMARRANARFIEPEMANEEFGAFGQRASDDALLIDEDLAAKGSGEGGGFKLPISRRSHSDDDEDGDRPDRTESYGDMDGKYGGDDRVVPKEKYDELLQLLQTLEEDHQRLQTDHDALLNSPECTPTPGDLQNRFAESMHRFSAGMTRIRSSSSGGGHGKGHLKQHEHHHHHHRHGSMHARSNAGQSPGAFGSERTRQLLRKGTSMYGSEVWNGAESGSGSDGENSDGEEEENDKLKDTVSELEIECSEAATAQKELKSELAHRDEERSRMKRHEDALREQVEHGRQKMALYENQVHELMGELEAKHMQSAVGAMGRMMTSMRSGRDPFGQQEDGLVYRPGFGVMQSDGADEDDAGDSKQGGGGDETGRLKEHIDDLERALEDLRDERDKALEDMQTLEWAMNRHASEDAGRESEKLQEEFRESQTELQAALAGEKAGRAARDEEAAMHDRLHASLSELASLQERLHLEENSQAGLSEQAKTAEASLRASLEASLQKRLEEATEALVPKEKLDELQRRMDEATSAEVALEASLQLRLEEAAHASQSLVPKEELEELAAQSQEATEKLAEASRRLQGLEESESKLAEIAAKSDSERTTMFEQELREARQRCLTMEEQESVANRSISQQKEELVRARGSEFELASVERARQLERYEEMHRAYNTVRAKLCAQREINVMQDRVKQRAVEAQREEASRLQAVRSQLEEAEEEQQAKFLDERRGRLSSEEDLAQLRAELRAQSEADSQSFKQELQEKEQALRSEVAAAQKQAQQAEAAAAAPRSPGASEAKLAPPKPAPRIRVCANASIWTPGPDGEHLHSPDDVRSGSWWTNLM
eukprot:TRINITY_DN36487_c0_g1_i1.p1 TRINITY_DN36487_c0_g1~~TRINITY_DN36487_c0_g1_i1.p1  ORF type:complete len:900 (-),score=282.23 TRINITY_DN36487_c0_g1_i1:210-2822(-)